MNWRWIAAIMIAMGLATGAGVTAQHSQTAAMHYHNSKPGISSG